MPANIRGVHDGKKKGVSNVKSKKSSSKSNMVHTLGAYAVSSSSAAAPKKKAKLGHEEYVPPEDDEDPGPVEKDEILDLVDSDLSDSAVPPADEMWKVLESEEDEEVLADGQAAVKKGSVPMGGVKSKARAALVLPILRRSGQKDTDTESKVAFTVVLSDKEDRNEKADRTHTHGTDKQLAWINYQL
ncbi:MAG: hypothetical protein Q9222_000083 [Ikaeria aurantiellina]